MKVKNWHKFQHYKSGRGAPPWIKLYRGLLNDKNWFALDPGAAKTLVSIWILAAESDGVLPDNETLAFRLRIDSKLLAKHITLCSEWLIDDSSKMLADCYHPATPETETETETDIVAPVSPSRYDQKAYLETLGVSESVISDWISLRKTKKAPATKTAIDGLLRESEKAGWTLSDALAYSCERGWTGFKAEWVDGIVPKKENLSDTVTLPDGRQMPRATFDFMQRMGV